MNGLVFRNRLVGAGLAIIAALLPSVSRAEDEWPSKRISLLVGFAAGGFADTVGRIIANKLGERLKQTVVVQNTSTIPVAGPVSLVIDALPVNVTLFGAEGQTTCAAPLGSPFVTINAGTDGVLTPGERVTLTLAFVNPLRKGITYATRVLAGPGCR